MECWRCGKILDAPPGGKLSFRATCDFCASWLHCCKNCIYYSPGMPNDCKVPGTDYIADREGSNFCEEFSLKGKAPPPSADPKDIAKKLFKDD